MIEFDDSEFFDCAMTDEELRLVRLFNSHETGDKLLYKWNDNSYSDELRDVISIVTNGIAPGGI